MTIEFSLRRRAAHSRWLACLYLGLAVGILIGTYISLPIIAGKTLQTINQIEHLMPNDGHGNAFQILLLVILILCLLAIVFAGYLLGRGALIEIESAARFNGLADALCIAGDNIEQFEIATAVLVPKTKYFPELSEKNLETFLEIVKTARG